MGDCSIVLTSVCVISPTVKDVWAHSQALHTKWGEPGNEAKQHQYLVLVTNVRCEGQNLEVYTCMMN